MLHSLTRILQHFANRVSIISQAHPKGMQLTISIMPCPNKIKDETLRQAMISPIVLVGNEEELESQLGDIIDVQTVAQDNPIIESSVADYLTTLAKASNKGTASKPTESGVKQKATAKSTTETKVTSNDDGLDDLFIE